MIVCDRCHKAVDGDQVYREDGVIIATCGYYIVNDAPEENWWARFRHSDTEGIVCDACMHADVTYIAIYGVMTHGSETSK